MTRYPDEAWDDFYDRCEHAAERAAEVAWSRATETQPPTNIESMGMMKDYLLQLQQGISEHTFGQDAVQWAIVTGLVTLSYNKQQDLATLVSKYDSIIDKYRAALQASRASMVTMRDFAKAIGLPESDVAKDIKEAA